MGVQLNLLIHGNPKGWSGWYNEHELDRTELDFLKGYYTTGDKSLSSPCFIIETRSDRGSTPPHSTSSVVTYYHLLITEGVSETNGRASGYVRLTLRIREAFIPDFLLVYQLLDRIFQTQVVSRLVEKKKGGGYQFLVNQLHSLQEDFLRWEKDLARLYESSVFGTKPYPQAPQLRGTEQRYALADLLEASLQSPIQGYLIQGNRLIFTLSTSSQRTQQATRGLQEQIRQKEAAYNTLKQANEQKIEEISRKHREQIDQDTKAHQDKVNQLQRSLEQKQAQLSQADERLSRIQAILSGVPSTGGSISQKSSSSTVSPSEPSTASSDQHRHEVLGGSRQRYLLIILVGLVVLLLLIQGYVTYSMLDLTEQLPHKTQVIPTKGDPTKYIPIQSSHEVEVAPDAAEAVVEPGTARAETKEEKPQEHIQGVVSTQTPHTTRTNESHTKPSPTTPTTKKSLSQSNDKDKPNNKKEPTKKK